MQTAKLNQSFNQRLLANQFFEFISVQTITKKAITTDTSSYNFSGFPNHLVL